MNQNYSYTWEKLMVAMDIMATGAKSRQHRLYNAYISSLIRLTPEDFPLDFHDTFRQFQAEMTSESAPAGGNVGTLQSTVWAMHWKTAERLSKTLFQLYQAVNEAYYNKESA